MNRNIGKDYKVSHQIYKGHHNQILCAVFQRVGREYAIKVELNQMTSYGLYQEYQLYQQFMNDSLIWDNGVPKVHYFGLLEDKYSMVVMDLLGPNLEDLFNLCGKKFSLKTVLMLADQMILCLQYIHSKQYIHRNVKPSNFLIGIAHKVYIIDFKLAKRNPFDKVFRGCCCTMGRSRTFEGSERFASISSHYTSTQIKQDDLESLGYIMIYFLKGRLPWQNCRASNTLERQEKIANEKMTTSIKDLCEGLPQEFSTYLEHVRNFKQNKQDPDHNQLRSLLKGLFDKLGYQMDYIYDWNLIDTNDAHLQLNHISMTGILLK